MKKLWALAICLSFVWPVTGYAQGSDVSRTRADNLENFVLALEAYRQDDWDRADLLHQQLVYHAPAYPLTGYLEFHQLRRQLPDAPAAEVLAYLRQHNDSPLAEDMRQMAMRAYGAAGKWQALRAISQGVPGNVTNRCYYYQAMLDQEPERALKAARDLYLTGVSRPDTCDPLFKALEEAGQLNDELIWQRMELAYRAGSPGLMRYLRSELASSEYRKRADTLLNLYHRPADLRLIQAGELSGRTLQAALTRLARKDPDYAWRLLPVLATRFQLTAEQRAMVQRKAAWYAVIRDGPTAHSWLDPWLASYADEELLEQRARVSVREQDWRDLLDWIARMPDSQQREANWLYWRGRALQETASEDKARPVLEAAADKRSFWGFLAAETLALPYPLNKADALTQLAPLSVTSHQVVARVELLLQAEEASLARSEWLQLIRSADRDQQLALASLADQRGWAHLAVETALFSGQHDQLDWRFPAHMAARFQAAAREQSVDPLLLMSVARRESAFNPHARSPVGARGLMQLMPATARAVARQLGTPSPTSDDLMNADLNLQLGSRYMADLLARYGGNRVLALAAYNAGPHRVDRWLREAPQPFDVFIESIPFRETREYVEAVLAYRVIFAHQLNQSGIAMMSEGESTPLYGPVLLASFSGTGACGTC